MSGAPRGRRAGRPSRDEESGSIIPLVAAYLALLIVLVALVVDVTAVQLARARLYDVADALALDAADAVSQSALFRQGVGTTVPVSDDSVRVAARRLLDAQERPPNVASWQLGDETGAEPVPGADRASATGAGAVVTLTGRIEVPMASGLLDAVGGSVMLTVRSRAQALVTPPRSIGSPGSLLPSPWRPAPGRRARPPVSTGSPASAVSPGLGRAGDVTRG